MPQNLQLRDIFDALGDGLFVADASGRYIEVNPAGCAMLGYDRDELLGLSLSDVVDDGELERLARTLGEMADNALHRSEWLFRCKDGSNFTGELVGGRLPDGRYQAIVRDVSARVEREQLVQLLKAEATHRTKNIIAVIQAIARRTATTAPDRFLAAFEERMAGLVASHELFGNEDWQAVGLAALVASQIAPFASGRSERISAAGDPVEVRPAAAQSLGMALHELATNAVKYGALSGDCGEVSIAWRVEEGERRRFTMTWREHGGPRVSPPTRTGFGTTMIARVTRQALNARSDLDYRPEGLVWTLDCDLAALSGPTT